MQAVCELSMFANIAFFQVSRSIPTASYDPWGVPLRNTCVHLSTSEPQMVVNYPIAVFKALNV